ncbi:hypothetical protein GGR51DRAFT_488248 [Nemania sp. FL0031]|nr:hypothetical protein GGR51DRAFT_488248 [Nemania sp. FL0031]
MDYSETQSSKHGHKESGLEKHDEESDYVDFDIAINHMSNVELRNRQIVQAFFKDVQKLTSLENMDTYDWLSRFPLDMYDEVIPLFEDDSTTGYQLHPSFTRIGLGQAAVNPHADVFYLSTGGNRLPLDDPDGLQLVMGIGRLFVNFKSDNENYLSKWTGYEVFVDRKLGLWMVFDRQLSLHKHGGWYEFGSKLVSPEDQDVQNTEPSFDFAKFWGSLPRIEEATFNDVRALIESTKQLGKVQVSQIEKEEFNSIVHSRPTILEAVGGGNAAQERQGARSRIGIKWLEKLKLPNRRDG